MTLPGFEQQRIGHQHMWPHTHSTSIFDFLSTRYMICFGRRESHAFDDIIEPFFPPFTTRFETIKCLVEDENETFQFFKL